MSIRLGRFVNPTDGRCVLVDCSGTVDLEDLVHVLSPGEFRRLDGLIVNVDSVLKHKHLFFGKYAPAHILRMQYDTFDVKLVEDLVLKALKMDFSALIYTLTIGYEDERRDSASVRLMAMLTEVCNAYQLPIIVEALPFGERVTVENYEACIGLAARMAVEAGSSMVAIPHLDNPNSVKKIVDAVKTCTLMVEKASRGFLNRLPSLLEAGLNGFILSPPLENGDPAKLLTDLLSIVHKGV